MTIYANATRSYTTSSAHAMRVRERLGLRALLSHVFACISTDRPTCNQLLYVVVQLHYQSTSWNVRLRSTLLAYMLDLLSQLSRAGSGWHTSTTVGIHRHICATSPLLFACFPKKISSTVILQIGDSWNISAAKLVGGARLRLFNAHIYLIFILSYLDYPEITLPLSPPRQVRLPRPSRLAHRCFRPRPSARSREASSVASSAWLYFPGLSHGLSSAVAALALQYQAYSRAIKRANWSSQRLTRC